MSLAIKPRRITFVHQVGDHVQGSALFIDPPCMRIFGRATFMFAFRSSTLKLKPGSQ
jgi:hypothetical protein